MLITDYRVLKDSLQNKDSFFIASVIYDDLGNPSNYTKLSELEADTPENLAFLSIHVLSALTKPVIDVKIFEPVKFTEQSKTILDKIKNTGTNNV